MRPGDHTLRMTALLGAMRRERNGAVADAMRPCGASYGLNYGVSLPTVRRLARAEGTDHDFARYLYLQDVRELRLAAFHVADPARLTSEAFDFWGTGIVNAELAEEAAFALLCSVEPFQVLFETWIADERPLLRYAALMAAARVERPDAAWIAPALAAVRRTETDDEPRMAQLVAQGAVALLAVVGLRNEANRQAVLRAVGSSDPTPAVRSVGEELAWRLA